MVIFLMSNSTVNVVLVVEVKEGKGGNGQVVAPLRSFGLWFALK